jgi:nicotinate-nucleotide adenylyltransferase
VRVALLGGTFDPPHIGHWFAAVDAYEALGLDRLVLVPAARQPLKQDRQAAPAADRLAMVRALVEGDPRFEVDPIELQRPGLSYTVDTLEAWRARADVTALYFVMGADALASFDRWKSPERIQRLAALVVLRRDADVVDLPAGVDALVLPSRRIDVSSTEVRARLRAGQSIRGFVPAAVEAYLTASGLYR